MLESKKEKTQNEKGIENRKKKKEDMRKRMKIIEKYHQETKFEKKIYEKTDIISDNKDQFQELTAEVMEKFMS